MTLAIKDNWKSGSTIRDLGCSIVELKRHLEDQFDDNMSWDNYGLDGWHIDHIVPLASFNLTDEDQFKKACHYTNLQPLWAKDNLSKGSK
jgi:AraC-like DNA-binding protein